MLDVEEATRIWVGRHLGKELVSATIDMETDSGWPCCGGSDPDCYCSMAESASSYFEAYGEEVGGKMFSERIDLGFAQILAGIVDVSNSFDK